MSDAPVPYADSIDIASIERNWPLGRDLPPLVRDSHLVLANSKRTCEEGQYVGPWQLEFICPAPQERWHPDAPLCQFGECCGHKMVSVGKTSVCPICSELVYGS
jgi:hypothetical protein